MKYILKVEKNFYITRVDWLQNNVPVFKYGSIEEAMAVDDDYLNGSIKWGNREKTRKEMLMLKHPKIEVVQINKTDDVEGKSAKSSLSKKDVETKTNDQPNQAVTEASATAQKTFPETENVSAYNQETQSAPDEKRVVDFYETQKNAKKNEPESSPFPESSAKKVRNPFETETNFTPSIPAEEIEKQNQNIDAFFATQMNKEEKNLDDPKLKKSTKDEENINQDDTDEFNLGPRAGTHKKKEERNQESKKKAQNSKAKKEEEHTFIPFSISSMDFGKKPPAPKKKLDSTTKPVINNEQKKEVIEEKIEEVNYDELYKKVASHLDQWSVSKNSRVRFILSDNVFENEHINIILNEPFLENVSRHSLSREFYTQLSNELKKEFKIKQVQFNYNGTGFGITQ